MSEFLNTGILLCQNFVTSDFPLCLNSITSELMFCQNALTLESHCLRIPLHQNSIILEHWNSLVSEFCYIRFSIMLEFHYIRIDVLSKSPYIGIPLFKNSITSELNYAGIQLLLAYFYVSGVPLCLNSILLLELCYINGHNRIQLHYWNSGNVMELCYNLLFIEIPEYLETLSHCNQPCEQKCSAHFIRMMTMTAPPLAT